MAISVKNALKLLFKNRERSQRLIALAVPLCGETDERDVLANCFKLLPRHKMPSEVKLVCSLHKNSNGKIDRQKYFELLQQKNT
jgi:acyl-CoA synthetase (AMP-forming)/AMP-acid ligase II